MLQGKSYLGYAGGHPSVQALKASIHFVAVCSMTEKQCRATFEASRSSMVAEYRDICEAAIGQTDFVTSSDVTVLQAFVLYLVSARVQSGPA